MVTTGPEGVNLHEMQGNIFCSYGRRYRAVRHLVLRVKNPVAARLALASMVDEDRETPDITRAHRKPSEAAYDWCLNVSFTWRGLEALGLPRSTLDSFPPEFRQGMVARADRLGDVGPSAPANWLGGLGDADNVHLVVTIHGWGPANLIPMTEQVLGLQGGRAFEQLSTDLPDGEIFPDPDSEKVHFGYRDGISQPRFEGATDDGPTPGRPYTPLGAILLGHNAPLPAVQWRVPRPADRFGHNGTFNAFRVLRQDVVGFEEFLHASATTLGCTPELVAAKLCGRWRNGAPLTLAPTEAESKKAFTTDEMNDFRYLEDDGFGTRCPIGSHIRRTNPRDARIVQRGSNDVRGVARRGMPFGALYNPEDPGPDERGVSRGLLGNFVCASLSAQFEAMQADWVNLGLLDPSITGTNDPLAGANDEATSTVSWPNPDGTQATLRGLPRFVTTLGGAYCFVPTIPAVKWVADEGWSQGGRRPAATAAL